VFVLVVQWEKQSRKEECLEEGQGRKSKIMGVALPLLASKDKVLKESFQTPRRKEVCHDRTEDATYPLGTLTQVPSVL